MLRSAIVLSGGGSRRLGGEKGLHPLAGRPMVSWVVERLLDVADEVIVVVGPGVDPSAYANLGAIVSRDDIEAKTPLAGASTGLSRARGEFSFMTGSDYPLVDRHVVEFLFSEAEGHEAATPIWPNGYLEPLHAVYASKPAAFLARRLLEGSETRLSLILRGLGDVRWIPIDRIREIDPYLQSLLDVDTEEDVDRAEALLGRPA